MKELDLEKGLGRLRRRDLVDLLSEMADFDCDRDNLRYVQLVQIRMGLQELWDMRFGAERDLAPAAARVVEDPVVVGVLDKVEKYSGMVLRLQNFEIGNSRAIADLKAKADLMDKVLTGVVGFLRERGYQE